MCYNKKSRQSEGSEGEDMGIERLSGNAPQNDRIIKNESKKDRVLENPEKGEKPRLLEAETFEKSGFLDLRAGILRLDPSSLDSMHRITRDKVSALLS